MEGENPKRAFADRMRARPAAPLRLQYLEKMLSLRRFLYQLDRLLATPIKIPGTSFLPYPGSPDKARHSIFSVHSLWSNEKERADAVSKLYNFKTLKSREWLRDVMVEESDSGSDGEYPFSEADLKILLKLHRKRRKYQKIYHNDKANRQFTYYGAGLISNEDPFPKNQDAVLEECADGIDES